MGTSIETILLGASILVLLSVIASKTSGRLGIPVLLLFLLIGMLAGSDGPGGIYFNDAWLSQSLGVVALALILFAGGLETKWTSVRPVLGMGLILSTLGVLLTAVSVGWFATLVLGFSWLEGLLLGAIVSSTDAAAVFAVLRFRNVRLKGSLESLLELESGSNDPMAVFLTIGVTRLLTDPAAPVTDLVGMFIQQMALGMAIGYGMGKGMAFIVNRLRLQSEGLYPVLTLALVLFTYGMTAVLGGNGFLAVYLAGIVMGNGDFIHKRSLIRFHDGLAWLMQIAMFLALGLLVYPSRLLPIIGIGLLVAGFLMFVARPVSVLVSLLLARISFREKAMISWVGLRGAVPIILATFPLLAGLPKADMLFHLVFFIVLTSVLFQGTSIPLLARWLKVESPAPARLRYPLELEPSVNIKSELAELDVPVDSTAIGKQILELGLPPGVLIVLISRNGEFIVPRGGTIIEAGDTMLGLADKKSLEEVRLIMQSRQPSGQAAE